MNNANLWLVVHPTVGIPIFLGAVAVGSFAVHVAVLNKTTWYEDYLVGAELGSGEGSAALKQEGTATVVFKGDGAVTEGLAREAVITLPDGRTATAVFDGKATDGTAKVAASLQQ